MNDAARPIDYRGPSAAPPAAGRPTWTNGLVVFVTVVLLGMAGAIAYAAAGSTSAGAEVAFRLIVEGGLVVAWLAAAAGWGAWPLAWLAGGRRGGDGLTAAAGGGGAALIVTTAVALGLGAVGFLALGLGLVGALNQATAAALLVVGVALGVGRLLHDHGRRGTADAVAAGAIVPAAAAAPPGSPAWDWLWLAAVPLLAAALAAAFVPPGLLWKPEEPHGYDAVEYHLQIPREWHDAGRIGPTPHNAFGYFPFGVEVHYLLAMHVRGGAWAGMYLAQLMHVALVATSAVATAGVARAVAPTRRAAAVGAVAAGTVPLLGQVGPIGFNEGGLLLAGTLSVGWALLAVRRATALVEAGDGAGAGCGAVADRRRPDGAVWPFVLAGLLAGLACGVKLTAGPLVLVAVPAVAFLALVRRSPRAAVVGPVAFGLAGALAFAPWLVRNAVWTGNPVFPEGTALFGAGHFDAEQVARWRHAHAAQPDQASPAARVAAFGSQVLANWQFGGVLLAVASAAALATLPAVRRSRPGETRPAAAADPQMLTARLLAGLLLVHAAFWLGFTHLQGRFFLPAVPLAGLLLATARWERPGGGRPTVPAVLAGGLPAVVFPTVFVGLALVGWWNVHRRLAFKLYEDQGTGVAVALGREDINWIVDTALAGFPRDDPAERLLLVGDAQAFWYPLAGDRLTYRTVFDLRTGPAPTGGSPPSLLDLFDPSGRRRDGHTWLLVNPSELERYARTYQPFPPIPAWLREHPGWATGQSFLIPPGGARE